MGIRFSKISVTFAFDESINERRGVAWWVHREIPSADVAPSSQIDFANLHHRILILIKLITKALKSYTR